MQETSVINSIVSRETIHNTTREKLLEDVKNLPNNPGVYQYFNSKDEIIYIGKAKNLRKRVASYFTKKQEFSKTYMLMKNIAYLKYIVVKTEADALLLENNLIKQFQPRYNLMLKDDKTYPYICISNEEFPRVFKTRKLVKDGSEYFGPYSLVSVLHYLLDVTHKVFPIRTCKLPMTANGIANNKYKVCLKYHIHLCNGVCQKHETRDEYLQNIENIRQIIKGNGFEIQKIILRQIKKHSDNLQFEQALELKKKYDLLDNFIAKTIIANTLVASTDCFGYDQTENSAFISILRVENGAIIQGQTVEYRKQIDEEKEDILSYAILNLREKFNSNSKEIIVPFALEFPIENVKVTIPTRGDRKKILDLAQQNVAQYKIDILKQNEKLNPDQRAMQLLKGIQEKLKLEKPPMRIEIFDNSNISGSNAVSACVVYLRGRPSKSDYRKYIIKSVEVSDDYASMREVVRRRYNRIIAENSQLPDLIIADGGVGQMNAIRQVIDGELKLNISIVGLAKNDNHRTNEILIGFPPQLVGLKPTDSIFKFFMSMQDEVHRFAIKFHRQKRSKMQVKSELDEIKGVGNDTKNKLLLNFKSVKRVKSANLEDLTEIIGKSRAKIIYEYFHNK